MVILRIHLPRARGITSLLGLFGLLIVSTTARMGLFVLSIHSLGWIDHASVPSEGCEDEEDEDVIEAMNARACAPDAVRQIDGGVRQKIRML